MIDLMTLGVGRHICPHCGGGRTQERSFAVWKATGHLVGQCKRASCGFCVSTYYPDSSYMSQSAPAPSPEVLRPYTGDRFPLFGRPVATNRVVERFGFEPPGICTVGYTTEVDREPFLIPILAPNGSERGVMEAVFSDVPGNKRRRIWKAKHEPMISWSAEGGYYDGVYLVEDQISALKLHYVASVRACALLGTSLNAESVAEIQRTARHVTIALDADATAKAFILARKWGAAFKSCQVQVLTQDIKDMSSKDIRSLMTDAGHLPTSSSGEF